MERKTATIRREPVYGTMGYVVRLCVRGKTLHYWENGQTVYLSTVDRGQQDVLDRLKSSAKARGFTHVKYEGDWGKEHKRTKPQGGKL